MIDPARIEDVVGSRPDRAINQLGLVDCQLEATLTFVDDDRFVRQLIDNPNIAAVLLTSSLADHIKGQRPDLSILVHDDPRWAYFTLHNVFASAPQPVWPSVIASTAQIHPSASIASNNVRIGERTRIGPGVVVLENIDIADDCTIQPGAVIGSDGFEFKRTSKGILPVRHDGEVRIEKLVHIGANSCVDQGFAHRHTVIRSETKIDNLVHIGHSAHIGRRCLIAACAQIGAVDMDDDVWVGPNVNLLSGQKIGAGAYITVGSVVTKDVEAGEKVTGNFAVPHANFIRHVKRMLRDD